VLEDEVNQRDLVIDRLKNEILTVRDVYDKDLNSMLHEKELF